MQLFNDKCEQVLKLLDSDSIEALVTDPPAGIAFMGKEWDKDHGGRDNWIAYMTSIFEQCLRVLKPGAHGLVWALPRTSHWTATALENAGFKVRDIVNFIFGSGFPKSLNIGKAVDKLQGNEREEYLAPIAKPDSDCWGIPNNNSTGETKNPSSYNVKTENIAVPGGIRKHTKGTSEWEGWGTALKPACEHWILVRKPLAEKTVAANVLAYGVGGINVDGCRIKTNNKLGGGALTGSVSGNDGWDRPWRHNEIAIKNKIERVKEAVQKGENFGRFPANVIHDGSEVVRAGFPNTKSGAVTREIPAYEGKSNVSFLRGITSPLNQYTDSGSAARFFYCAKASKTDRDEGLEVRQTDGGFRCAQDLRNNHPTVKSTELMRYLCKLICPPNGTVLDPFMGSGSTGKAAVLEGFDFIGIEQDAEYFKIAEARINFVMKREDKQVRMAI